MIDGRDADPYLPARLSDRLLSQERFLLLRSHVPAVEFSSSGVILRMNSAALNGLGLSERAILGQTLYQAGCRVIAEDGTRLLVKEQPWMVSMSSGLPVANVIMGLILPDGSCRWQQCTSIPFMAEGQRKPAGAVAIMTDITRYRQTQSQLLQSQKMEAIGSMAGGLAHDFNNILSSIRSAVQLVMLDHEEEGKEYKALRDIESEALRGSELIKQLLMFSKPSHGSAKRTEINERTRQLRKLLRRTIPKNIKTRLDLSENETLVRIAPAQFDQILLNLAINARDAMPKGGELRITTKAVIWNQANPSPLSDAADGTYVRIDVEDDGMGIDAENLSRIMEPFYTSKAGQGGTGLGLSIVYSIVHQHGGHIMIDSVSDRGTIMTVFLPVSKARRRERRKVETAVRPQGGHETVLIADDEEILTRSTAGFLSRYGYHVMTACDGRAALDIYDAHGPEIDLILLDMEMPEVNGPDCLAEILKRKPSAKVIAFSGHLLKPQEWDPIKAGARRFIQKPYDSNILLRVLREVLDG